VTEGPPLSSFRMGASGSELFRYDSISLLRRKAVIQSHPSETLCALRLVSFSTLSCLSVILSN
jgi:hypothetical protein